MFSLSTKRLIPRLTLYRPSTAAVILPRLRRSYAHIYVNTQPENNMAAAATAITPAMLHSTPGDYGLNRTSGYKQPVWIATEPYTSRPRFKTLATDVSADVVVVGGGIAGISVAYEAVTRGLSVVLIEARDTLSGETGRTSGHLASFLDDHYYELIKSGCSMLFLRLVTDSWQHSARRVQKWRTIRTNMRLSRWGKLQRLRGSSASTAVCPDT